MSKCIRCSQKALEPGVVVEGGTVLIRALNFLYTCWLLCLDHLPASGAHLEHTFISHLGWGWGGLRGGDWGRRVPESLDSGPPTPLILAAERT